MATKNHPGHQVGQRVGCTYRDCPPQQPWLHRDHRGTVIARDDPRAWAGTIAFPGPGAPTQKAVREHLAKLDAMGVSVMDKIPVAWDFGKVYWESAEALYAAPAEVVPLRAA